MPKVLYQKSHQKRLSLAEVREGIALDEAKAEADRQRPRTRSQCPSGPCPFVSCRYHLYLEITGSGNLKINFPDKGPLELEHACSLDLAEEGGMTLDEVAAVLGITRERVRQIEASALEKVRAYLFPRYDPA